MSLYKATIFTIVRWEQALLSTSEMPEDNVLESLYKMRLQESEQLRSVLAMYEPEIDQHFSDQVIRR